MIYNEVLSSIEDNKKRRERGDDIVIPFPFRRFSRYVPGIEPESLITFTASSKVGKTQGADYMYMYAPFEYYMKKKHKVKLKIYYFSLELSKQRKVRQAIAHYLFRLYGERLSPQRLESKFEAIDESVLTEIKSLKDKVFEDFEKVVTFINNLRTPRAIYNFLRSEAEANGELLRNEFRIAIIDHVSLLLPDKGMSDDLHKTLGQWSSEYCLDLRDTYRYTIVNVHQQSASQEGIENFKLDKLQPNLNGLADNKIIGRDSNLVLGLFDPNRHKFKKYLNYDIDVLGDKFRELSVIANREGECVSTPLYFDGAINYFEELPYSTSAEMADIYKSMKEKDRWR